MWKYEVINHVMKCFGFECMIQKENDQMNKSSC